MSQIYIPADEQVLLRSINFQLHPALLRLMRIPSTLLGKYHQGCFSSSLVRSDFHLSEPWYINSELYWKTQSRKPSNKPISSLCRRNTSNCTPDLAVLSCLAGLVFQSLFITYNETTAVASNQSASKARVHMKWVRGAGEEDLGVCNILRNCLNAASDNFPWGTCPISRIVTRGKSNTGAARVTVQPTLYV